ncbi:hypothetical protein PTKIN_Ptkin16aG0008600 [Pterospermum kingtungense]
MFDWNDEELTNIIWGEAGEIDDQTVPYQEGSENCHGKKERSRETKITKSTEQNAPGNKVDLHGRKKEVNSSFITNEGTAFSGFGMGSWPELSSSNASKTDQDSINREVSNSLLGVTKCSSKNAKTAELGKDPENFQNPYEGKEQGVFVDYSWANIGSFDDLDWIFSNDDQIFGNVSLGSADELWSSSKDVTNSLGKSFPTIVDSPAVGALRSISDHLEVKRKYEQQEKQSFTLSYRKLDGSTSHGLHNVEFLGDKSKSIIEEQTNAETVEKTSPIKSHMAAEKVMTPYEMANKAYRQKKLLKFRKKAEEIGVSQQRQLHGSDSLQYQHMSNTFGGPSTYGNLTSQYPVIPVFSNVQSGEFNQQPLLSCCDVSPGKANLVNKSVEAATKPLSMTPQEKIEKLRRRQQMRALLAIQKQQQQFTPCSNHSVIQKSGPENQAQHIEGTDVQELSTFASFDPNSPLEQDDSCSVSFPTDDNSVEETVLYQLQDAIAKLDATTRLCIRDSLFRLAQNRKHRRYASDTSSTNKSSRDENKVAEEENNKCNRMSETETETNPIDRTVAHLLFHRPLELSGKHSETPESPASAKFRCEQKSAGLTSLSTHCISDDSQIKQNLEYRVSEVPSSFVDPQHVEQFKNSLCMDTSENASNYGPADGVAEIEASQ